MYVAVTLSKTMAPVMGQWAGGCWVSSAEFSFGVDSSNLLTRATAPMDVSSSVQLLMADLRAALRVMMLNRATPVKPTLVVWRSDTATATSTTATTATMRSRTRFSQRWMLYSR